MFGTETAKRHPDSHNQECLSEQPNFRGPYSSCRVLTEMAQKTKDYHLLVTGQVTRHHRSPKRTRRHTR